MSKITRRVFSFFSLLFRGEFFLLLQAFARLLPSRVCRMKKNIFYHFDPKTKNHVRFADGIKIFAGSESSVQEIVRDLYGNSYEMSVFYRDFYQQGIVPWIAMSNEKVTGVVWLYTGSYLSMWEGYDAWLLNIEIEPAAKFVANVFVDPQLRGKGIFSLIAESCFAAHSESMFYSCVEASNIVSIRSHEKIGFRRCGTAYFIRFFQKTFCFFVPKKGKFRFLFMTRGQAADVSLLPS